MTGFSVLVLIVLLLWKSLFITVQTATVVNVALNKPCSMSSSYTRDRFNNSCSCAINGNTGTTYVDGNCIHTDPLTDRTPSWTVYLGQNYTIQKIAVYARDYEFSIRLSNVQVFIDDVEVYKFTSPSKITEITEKLPKTGSRVRLQKLDDGLSDPQLTICEVQVFALVTYCEPNPCVNGGTCSEGPNTYSCSCREGYTGKDCSTDVDECVGQPNPCSPGSCNNTNGSYYCHCPPGYIGFNNCTDVNECLKETNCTNGTCVNYPGSYYCQCGNGYAGNGTTSCSDIDECTRIPNPCNPGNCSNTIGSYTCQCPAAFNGTGTTNCTDINECDDDRSLCLPGNCSNTDGSYNCTCPPGYAGTNNCTDINECENSTDVCNNGTCVNNPGSYSCDCNKGYSGQICEKDINECDSNPCKHGNCTDLVAKYSCNCWPGFNGSNCETEIVTNSSAPMTSLLSSSEAIIGGVVGGGVAAIIVIIVVVCVVRRRKNKGPQRYVNNGLDRNASEAAEGRSLSNTDYSIPQITKKMDGDTKPRQVVSPQPREKYIDPLYANKGGDNEIEVRNSSPDPLYGNTEPRASNVDSSLSLDSLPTPDGNVADHKEVDLILTAKPAVPAKPKPNASPRNKLYENVTIQTSNKDPAPAKQERATPDKKPTVPPKGNAVSQQRQTDDEIKLEAGKTYSNTAFEEEEEVYGHANMYAMYGSNHKATSMLDDFQKQLLEQLKGADTLETEFKAFPRGMLHPHEVGIDPKNNKKNRFQQLCAYDKNRVILRRPKDDLDTDYINASWIQGLDNEKAYIAAQGPKANSVADFWWMVWQDNVAQIVMLTNLKEDGKSKCEQYWPEVGSSITYRNIMVTAEREVERADFTIRTFLICPKGGKQNQKTVYQYHYVAWADHHIPEAASLVNFWRYVTARAPPAAPPVIHCSAGVGRTGTYIALDIAIGRVSRGLDVNVFDIVMELREQRSIMVQTNVQYKFLHEVILEAYTSRNSRLTAEQLDLRFPTDIDVNTPDTAVDNEFRLLKEIKGWAKPNNASAELDENRDKNRDPKVLPEEEHIVFLSVYVKGRNQYINAVYLSSFIKRRGLLLTQLPLPHTLVDLWRLVEGCDVTTILSLGAKDDEKTVKDYCRYWPRLEEELTTGPYHLTCTNANKDTASDHILVNNVLMTTKDTSHSVKIIRYTDWSGDVPGNISDVIYLVSLVRAASEESEGPVLIQCLDGATRSGLFCVLYDVICRLTEDDEVDIFPVVRHVQCVRRPAVSTEKQYRYCYRVAQEFNRSRSVYANTNS